MNRPLRVALLGYGGAARYLHFPVLRRLPGVTLAAVAELDPQLRAEVSAQAPGARSFSDYRELIAQAELDAVVIALPNPLHVPAAVAAFERGLHVYLEKPLGLSLEDGQRAVDAWRKSGRVGMMGYNYRFGPAHLDARRLIAAGRIGKVVAWQSVFASAVRPRPDWKLRRESGGGALLDLASHHLDLAAWMLDRAPTGISCRLTSTRSEHDTAAVNLEFGNDCTAQITASISAVDNDRIEVTGDTGRIVLDRYRSDGIEVHPASLAQVRLLRARHAVRDLVSPEYWLRKFTNAGPEASYWNALTAFTEAVCAGTSVAPTIDDGYRGLVWIDAAERSARDSRTIAL